MKKELPEAEIKMREAKKKFDRRNKIVERLESVGMTESKDEVLNHIVRSVYDKPALLIMKWDLNQTKL